MDMQNKTVSKYLNVQRAVDGYVFDSVKEANRYGELKLLVYAKEIRNLVLQPRFVVQCAFTDNQGKKHRPIVYVADFEYVDEKRGKVVEDVKGMKTSVYKLKKKLFLCKYRQCIFEEV